MSLLFIGVVFIISSLVILYSDDYIFGDLNIIRFILLVRLMNLYFHYNWQFYNKRVPVLFSSCAREIYVTN